MLKNLDPCRSYLASKIYSILSGLPEGSSLGIAEADVYKMIEKPPQEEMGDYSLPCFRFAKALKLPPPKVAQTIADALSQVSQDPWVENAETLQAFLNTRVKKSRMAQEVLPLALSSELFNYPMAAKGSRERVMVEYSQPNTHKEFHVGHLRNVCLGSAVVNLHRYCGYQVTAVNYYGDEGAHIAKCLWMMDKTKETPPPSADKGAWLGAMYVRATLALDDLKDDALKAAESDISKVLQGIESKSGPWFELWRATKEWSLDEFRSVYKWMNVEFDRDFYESEVSEESQTLVNEYLKKGVFKEDQGAIGIDLSDSKLGFMLVRKRDGNTLYATKDLVLAERKFKEFKIDRSVYVVASEQNHHFKQVFKTLEIMGFPQAKQCFHLSYGMVVLPSGKMSSRMGNTVPFMALKDSMMNELESILAKYASDWSSEELAETAKRLTIGALKYGMLQADPTREIVFDLKDWLSFEGNTGPYLMYSYSRCCSILRKAAEHGHKPLTVDQSARAKYENMEPSEHQLLRYIHDFNVMVQEACEQYRPSHLCTHLFYMCKAFSRFYADVPILKSTDGAKISERLALVQAFAETLKAGLALIGTVPPERM